MIYKHTCTYVHKSIHSHALKTHQIVREQRTYLLQSLGLNKVLKRGITKYINAQFCTGIGTHTQIHTVHAYTQSDLVN